MRDSAKTSATTDFTSGAGRGGFLFPWRLRRQKTQEPTDAEPTGITKEQIRSLFSKELGLAARKNDGPEQERARRIRSALYDPEMR
jgi:hypothetical protein